MSQKQDQQKAALFETARDLAGRATRLDMDCRYAEAQAAYADAGEALIKALSLEQDDNAVSLLLCTTMP